MGESVRATNINPAELGDLQAGVSATVPEATFLARAESSFPAYKARHSHNEAIFWLNDDLLARVYMLASGPV